jgi:hypothetical protein
MTFVYEPLDEDAAAALKAKVRKFQSVLSMTPAQVIDRSRDIVFLDLGGQGSSHPKGDFPPTHFAMLWKGAVMAFEGFYTMKGRGSVEMTFDLTRLAIPQHMRGDLPAIEQAATEAMTVYWEQLNRLPTSVKLNFPRPVYY